MTNVLLDLAAVRLASLNQTLDPWLYIILRRSTCLRLTRGVKSIKTKCLKVFGIPFYRNSNVFNEGEAQNRRILAGIRPNHRPRSNGEEERDNIANQKAVSPPDVMQSVGDGNVSPLPDITNTAQNKDSSYVCKFQFGKSVSPKQEHGMYVKILYLQNNPSGNAYVAKQSDLPVICCNGNMKQFNNQNIPQPAPPGTNSKQMTNFNTFLTKTSETGTKESSLSHDINADFHSDVPNDQVCLRRVHARYNDNIKM